MASLVLGLSVGACAAEAPADIPPQPRATKGDHASPPAESADEPTLRVISAEEARRVGPDKRIDAMLLGVLERKDGSATDDGPSLVADPERFFDQCRNPEWGHPTDGSRPRCFLPAGHLAGVLRLAPAAGARVMDIIGRSNAAVSWFEWYGPQWLLTGPVVIGMVVTALSGEDRHLFMHPRHAWPLPSTARPPENVDAGSHADDSDLFWTQPGNVATDLDPEALDAILKWEDGAPGRAFAKALETIWVTAVEFCLSLPHYVMQIWRFLESYGVLVGVALIASWLYAMSVKPLDRKRILQNTRRSTLGTRYGDPVVKSTHTDTCGRSAHNKAELGRWVSPATGEGYCEEIVLCCHEDTGKPECEDGLKRKIQLDTYFNEDLCICIPE